MKTIVFPVADADTFVVGVVSVPEPSAALTVTEGEEPRFVSELVEFEVDFSCACQVAAPVDEVAVAPEPPLLLSPYVIVIVDPPARVTPETVIVWDETLTDPVLEVVYPLAEPVVEGALQPLGTTTVTEPLESPPVAAVYVNVSVLPFDEADTFDVDVVSVPEPSAA